MGRNPEHNRKRRDDQREAILAQALDLFVRRGLTATRISDIAQAVGISQGLAYHYFPSKDAIFTALLEDAFTKMNAACKALEAREGPAHQKIRDALTELLAGFVAGHAASRWHLFIAMASASEAIPAGARRTLSKHAKIPYEVMERIILQGQKEGTVRPGDARALSVLFWSTVKGLAIHHAVHGQGRGWPDVQSLLPSFLREPSKESPCKVSKAASSSR
jgi:AcrR family transcriptional regulator